MPNLTGVTHSAPSPWTLSLTHLSKLWSPQALCNSAPNLHTSYTGSSSYLDLCFTLDPSLVLECSTTAALATSDHRGIRLNTLALLLNCGPHARLDQSCRSLDSDHRLCLAALAPWDIALAEANVNNMYDLYTYIPDDVPDI
ncbi:hypothetical protein HPB49_007640 [Dermacentor silvarum]|uniref:Uncharacterized protein n=1 Tax=Dermacentor silvarum TaxID=543639 RepID=A0ACB8CW81_DERSI|nr:hypothetical protein HPB49_007640 [Dermacentor silvarum]